MTDACGLANRVRRDRLVLIFSMSIYILIGLALARESLSYYWNWDDLHLIRRFSASELRGVWGGPWDLDNVETLGLRPFTTWFNHCRAVMLGESPVLHRVFLIVLFAAYLTSLGRLVALLGSPWWVGTLAGILTLCAKYSYFHFVWITDGIHLFCGVLFLAAAHMLLRDVDRPAVWRLAAVLGCAAAALLAREDSLAVFPVLLVLSTAYAIQRRQFDKSIGRIAPCGGALAFIALGFLAWRRLVVPVAPWELHALGLAKHMFCTPCLAGAGPFWTPAGHLLTPAFLLLCLLTVAAMARLAPVERIRAAVWLLCALIACAPGLVVARRNLLLFPISFYSIFVVTVLAGVFRNFPLGRSFVTVFVLLICTISANESRVQQQSLHPMSLDQIRRDWEMIYRDCAKCAIPESRVKYVQRRLDKLRVSQATPDFDAWEAELRSRGWVRPTTDDQVFVPRQRFLGP